MEFLGGYDSDSSNASEASGTAAGGRKRGRSISAQSPAPQSGPAPGQGDVSTAKGVKRSNEQRSMHARAGDSLRDIMSALPAPAEAPAFHRPSAHVPQAPPQRQQHGPAAPAASNAPRAAQGQAPVARHAPAPQSVSGLPSAPAMPSASSASTTIPAWAAHLDKRSQAELAAMGMLPGQGKAQSTDGRVVVTDLDAANMLGEWDPQAALTGSLAVPEKQHVTVSYWNAAGGTATTTSAPTKGQRRKNQVNALASHYLRHEASYQAADSAASRTKRMSRAKYGW